MLCTDAYKTAHRVKCDNSFFLNLYKTDDIIFHEIDIIRYKVNELGRLTHYLTTISTPLMSVLTDKYGQYEAE